MAILHHTVTSTNNKRASALYKDEAAAKHHCDEQNAKAANMGLATKYSIAKVDDKDINPAVAKEIR